MIFDIVMPKMGESLTEGTVLEWKKTIGDSIDKDETLLEIATDKVDAEIPSPVSGTLVEIIGEVNKTYEIDTVIARVETSDDVSVDTGSDSPETPPQTALKSSPAPAVHATIPPNPQQVNFGDSRFYSPLVRSIAAQEGISPVELQQIPGSGFRGRVSKKDVLFYLQARGSGNTQAAPATGLEPTGLADKVDQESVEIIDMDTMRKSIAKHMRQSLDTSAHVYVISEVDMTPIMDYLAKYGAGYKSANGHSLTVTHCLTAAVRDTLQEFPLLNASLDGEKIIQHKHLNIGIAVAVGDGLVVPPVRNSEKLSLKEIAAEVSGIVKKARNRKLKLEDLEGSTFSITNFGVFGSLAGFPIINQPNVAILGVGAVKKKPVVVESGGLDEIIIRQMGTLTLGFDHRLIDGAMGASFLETLVKNLENFDFSALKH